MPLRFPFPALCECPEIGGVIALDPAYDESRGIVTWHDLSHRRVFDLGPLDGDGREILQWRDRRRRTLWLRPLTLDRYNTSMASRFSGGRMFGTISALLQAARDAAAIAV